MQHGFGIGSNFSSQLYYREQLSVITGAAELTPVVKLCIAVFINAMLNVEKHVV
jgi:hypothetical protein